MKSEVSVFSACFRCGKNICYGNAAVTFSRHIEQVDQTAEFPDGQVTVIQCDVLLTLCASCGNRFSTERATEVLEAAVKQHVHGRN
jgi:hypothetical protein